MSAGPTHAPDDANTIKVALSDEGVPSPSIIVGVADDVNQLIAGQREHHSVSRIADAASQGTCELREIS